MAFLKKVLLSGFFSGLVLGLFLKWAEWLSNKQVYLLLLNVDFVPIINRKSWSEASEFFFHLIVSFFIAGVFLSLLQHTRRVFPLSFLISFFAALLYFPLAALSFQPIVSALDMSAFAWWTAGHALYGLVLGVFGQKYKRKA